MLIFLLTLAAAPALQTQAQELFANQSTNPSATQFRNLRLVGDAVCGEVNKPNSQGGYDGFRRFVYKSPAEWALAWAGDYKVKSGGEYVDTEYLMEESRWRPGRTADEINKASELI